MGDWIDVSGVRGEVVDHALLATTLQVFQPNSSHSMGKTAVVSNSLFVTAPVRNLTVVRDYTFHTFAITFEPELDLDGLEPEIARIIETRYGPHREDAARANARIERRSGVEILDPETRVRLSTTDLPSRSKMQSHGTSWPSAGRGATRRHDPGATPEPAASPQVSDPMTRDRFRAVARWVRSNVELGALLVLGLVIAGFWAFAELADEVIEGTTRNLDRDILLLLRTPGDPDDPIGPDWVEEIMRDFTAVGGIAVLTLTTLAVAGFFLLQRKFASTLYLLVAVGGGLLISTVAKEAFDRPRPDIVAYGSIVYTASFPSGHSMLAAVTYLTFSVLVARTSRRASSAICSSRRSPRSRRGRSATS